MPAPEDHFNTIQSIPISAWEGSKIIITSLIISGFAGIVKFFAKNEHKKENSLGLFFIKLLESCFVGVMTGWFCKANEL